MFDREPFGVAFPIGVTRIPIIEQMTEFVNQDIIEIEILDRYFGPYQLPLGALLYPFATGTTPAKVRSPKGVKQRRV